MRMYIFIILSFHSVPKNTPINSHVWWNIQRATSPRLLSYWQKTKGNTLRIASGSGKRGIEIFARPSHTFWWICTTYIHVRRSSKLVLPWHRGMALMRSDLRENVATLPSLRSYWTIGLPLHAISPRDENLDLELLLVLTDHHWSKMYKWHQTLW